MFRQDSSFSSRYIYNRGSQGNSFLLPDGDPHDWIKYAAYFIALQNMKPNAVTIAPTMSVITGIGGKETPIGYGSIYQTKESFSFTDGALTFEDGLVYGWDLSASAAYTEWFNFGNLSNFSKETFDGNRTEFEVGISYGEGKTYLGWF